MKNIYILFGLILSQSALAQDSPFLIFNSSNTHMCSECIGQGTFGGSSSGCSTAQMSGNVIPYENYASWDPNLVFEENFDDSNIGLDVKWNSPNHFGSGQDDYTCFKRANLVFGTASTGEHYVNLQTRYEPGTCCDWFGGNCASNTGVLKDYTVPILIPQNPDFSLKDFGPGKYEIRCKIPSISGQWPAFWLFSNQDHGHGQEIDVFEIKQDPVPYPCQQTPGCGDDAIYTIHDASRRMIMTSHYYPNDSPHEGDAQCAPNACYMSPFELDDDWHTYTLIWDNDVIQWQLDGNPIYTRHRFYYLPSQNITVKDLTFPRPDINMYLNITTSVWENNMIKTAYYDWAGNLHTECGPPDVPNDFLVDYVRVWKRQCNEAYRTLRYDIEPFSFFDPDNVIIRGSYIDMSATAPTWLVNSGQKFRLGATDQIKLVNFEARGGSEFTATIQNCENLSYKSAPAISNNLLPGNITSTSKAFEVFPNPSNGHFSISSENVLENVTVEVYDLTGKNIYRKIFPQFKNEQINISTLPSGVYPLRIYNAAGLNEKYKLVKD